MGLTEYTPVALDEDYGVDAKGINANGDKTMVQVKFRSNRADTTTFPTYAEIARTFTSGVKRHGLDPSKDSNVFVFTTADDVSIQCRTELDTSLVVISYDVIQRAIDNNRNFWKLSYQAVQEYVGYYNGSYTI